MYITNCLANATTYDQLLEYISKNYEYIDQYNFQYRICRKILCDIFGVNLGILKLDLLKKYAIDSNCVFGHKRVLDGVVYSSNGEYYIAKLLVENDIKFSFNLKYPFSGETKAYRYDFYLPEYSYYVEYSGMLLNGVNENKIIVKYDVNMKDKIKLCKTNNLNLFVSCDYLGVIEFIKKLENEKKDKNN